MRSLIALIKDPAERQIYAGRVDRVIAGNGDVSDLAFLGVSFGKQPQSLQPCRGLLDAPDHPACEFQWRQISKAPPATEVPIKLARGQDPGYLSPSTGRDGLTAPYSLSLFLLDAIVEAMAFHARPDRLAPLIGDLDRRLGNHKEESLQMRGNGDGAWIKRRVLWEKAGVKARINCIEPSTCDTVIWTSKVAGLLAQLNWADTGEPGPLASEGEQDLPPEELARRAQQLRQLQEEASRNSRRPRPPLRTWCRQACPSQCPPVSMYNGMPNPSCVSSCQMQCDTVHPPDPY